MMKGIGLIMFLLLDPGFQIAQTFVENVFENHVNWTDLLQNDDNYKNILQVLIQKRVQNNSSIC